MGCSPALSLLLLVGAGLFLRTLHNLRNVDAGFQPGDVLTLRVQPVGTDYQGERLANFWKDVTARVERLPGVRAVSLSARSPLDGGDRVVLVEVSGFTARSQRDKEIRLSQVSPGYLQTFGIALKQGRGFTAADNETAPRVALLNEAAARFYCGDRSSLGAQIRFSNNPPGQPAPVYEIVGVGGDMRTQNLREPDTRTFYLPAPQARERLGVLTLALRAEGGLGALTKSVSNELRAIGPDILLTDCFGRRRRRQRRRDCWVITSVRYRRADGLKLDAEAIRGLSGTPATLVSVNRKPPLFRALLMTAEDSDQSARHTFLVNAQNCAPPTDFFPCYCLAIRPVASSLYLPHRKSDNQTQPWEQTGNESGGKNNE